MFLCFVLKISMFFKTVTTTNPLHLQIKFKHAVLSIFMKTYNWSNYLKWMNKIEISKAQRKSHIEASFPGLLHLL